MTFQEHLKALRKKAGLTQRTLAEKSGVSYSYVTKLESGEADNPTYEILAALSAVLGAPLGALYDFADVAQDKATVIDNIVPMPGTHNIPLLGAIACGEPILATDNIECDVAVPENIEADFALRCKGDSMIDARISDGDIVYIRQQPLVENGEIAAVLIGDEATLKKFYREGDTVTLMPCNVKCPPFVYTGEQINEVSILGKAVGFTSTKLY